MKKRDTSGVNYAQFVVPIRDKRASVKVEEGGQR